MRAFLAAVLLPLALVGCGLLDTPLKTPSEIADSTTLDERAAISAELAYKSARLAAEVSVDAGLLTGDLAAKVAEYDRRAYAALQGARAAYQSGNAETYDAALREAQAAISAIVGAIQQ